MHTSSPSGNSCDFFPKRVVRHWNLLPVYVKSSKTVNMFKGNLMDYKKQNFLIPGNYWELSQEIFTRINNDSRESYQEYMLNHPYIAKRKGINTKK